MASTDNMNLSIANASSISDTITSNNNSISSLSTTDPQKFVSNATSNVTSAIGDPVGSVLNKTLSKIADVSTLADKKVNDLTSDLANFQAKNGQVQLVGNTIVITVSSKDAAKGASEKQAISSKISSIRTTLTTLNSTINTLSGISTTISVIQKLLQIQEVLLTANPVTKAAFSVFKTAIKVVFLKDMLNTYSNLITDQLTKSKQTLNQLTQRFLHLQVSLNIQDNTNQGVNTSETQALDNVTQDLLGGEDLDHTSETFTSFSSKVYILKVEKISDKQLIGKAYDKQTGQLAVQTAPSYISSSDELISELKQIINV